MATPEGATAASWTLSVFQIRDKGVKGDGGHANEPSHQEGVCREALLPCGITLTDTVDVVLTGDS